jgi:hypothetical protein
MVENLQAVAASNGSSASSSPELRSSELPYGVLMGAFAALLLLAGRARRDDVHVAFGPWDLACVGLASHDIGRILARDRIAVFVRAPFASGEAAQDPRGHGMRRAAGELLTCPHCLSAWVAAALSAAFVHRPRRARFVTAVFAGHAIADACDSIARRLTPR